MSEKQEPVVAGATEPSPVVNGDSIDQEVHNETPALEEVPRENDKQDAPPAVKLPETSPRGEPAIDIKCGPLLRYLGMLDSKTPEGWRGSAMIATKDESSDYSVAPFLTLSTDKQVEAVKFHEQEGMTFWRFPLEIPMAEAEQQITYSVNNDHERAFSFYVPALGQTMNTVFHSCNGFSYSVDTNEFKGELWRDVLRHHEDQHYHVMLGGGDQIYCDAIMDNCSTFKKWTAEHNPLKKRQMKFDKAAEDDMSSFFMWHYMSWFGAGYWKGMKGATLQPELPKAMAQIPMVNIYDDHDIIDGFGSYNHHTMKTPIFQGVGNVAFKYYLIFQHQVGVDESVDDEPSWDMGREPGPYIKQRNRSVYARLGKAVGFYGLDCRTERKKDQIVRADTYEIMFERMKKEIAASNGEIGHMLVMLGVPIAYPRLVWLENVLTSRLMEPIKALARKGFMSGLINEFDGSVEILDDLDDHWCAKHHKKERNWLVKSLLEFGKANNVRITVLSGDVHLCGIGRFYDKRNVDAVRDSNLMFNIVSSAIVNTPPPVKMADFLNKRNKIHHLTHTVDEDMVKIFAYDVDGTKRNNQRLLPRRNWCSIIHQGDNARGGSRAAGPSWDLLTGHDSQLDLPDSEPLYADDPTSLSVTLHVEQDQHSAESKTKPYQLLIPKLNCTV